MILPEKLSTEKLTGSKRFPSKHTTSTAKNLRSASKVFLHRCFSMKWIILMEYYLLIRQGKSAKSRVKKLMSEKIIFIGTPDFAVFYLNALFEAGFKIAAVLTNPDRKVGKSIEETPVKKWAKDQNIKVFDPVQVKDVLDETGQIGARVGIMAYYGKILPKEFLALFPRGVINVHHSLLPRWRGPAPIQASLLAGDKMTGVTLLATEEKVDSGDILARREVEISDSDNYIDLEKKLTLIGASLLLQTMPKYLSGEIRPEKQDDSKASYCRRISTEDAKIDWEKPAQVVHNQIRALNPNPGTYTFWNNKRLLILSARLETGEHKLKPGTVLLSDGGFKIAAEGGFIKPLIVKLEGKKETGARDFILGNRNIVGSVSFFPS